MKLRIFSLFFLLLLGTTACKDKNTETQEQNQEQAHQHENHDAAADEHNHQAESMEQRMAHEQSGHEQSETIVKQVGSVQVSIDISTTAVHHQMMQNMNMEMNHSSNTSHYVMITLMDQDKHLLEDIAVKIKVIDPEGQSLGDESGLPMETMSGKGMFHYGHGFDFKTPGKYQILVMFKYGDEVLSTGTEWELK